MYTISCVPSVCEQVYVCGCVSLHAFVFARVRTCACMRVGACLPARGWCVRMCGTWCVCACARACTRACVVANVRLCVKSTTAFKVCVDAVCEEFTLHNRHAREREWVANKDAQE